jgi:hypothetical protein
MTVQQSFLALAGALDELDRALDHLAWAVGQGQPPRTTGDGDRLSPVGQLDDLVQELCGWGVEARQTLDTLHGRPLADVTQAYRALVACQRFAILLVERFNNRLVDPDVLTTLDYLSRDADAGWQSWAVGVRDAIERCRSPLHELNGALLQCWQELTEHSELPNLTVSARHSPGEWPVGRAPDLIQTDPGAPGS